MPQRKHRAVGWQTLFNKEKGTQERVSQWDLWTHRGVCGRTSRAQQLHLLPRQVEAEVLDLNLNFPFLDDGDGDKKKSNGGSQYY
jgi:hypothetical protein